MFALLHKNIFEALLSSVDPTDKVISPLPPVSADFKVITSPTLNPEPPLYVLTSTAVLPLTVTLNTAPCPTLGTVSVPSSVLKSIPANLIASLVDNPWELEVVIVAIPVALS